MSSSTPEWRIFFNGICQGMGKEGREDLARLVGVSVTTINRWRRGPDTPTGKHLEALLAALPKQQSEQLAWLLRGDPDPKVRSLLSGGVLDMIPPPEERQEILLKLGKLDTFFIHLLQMQRESPEPQWQLQGSILRQALMELETHPDNTGINLVVCTCRPLKDGKTRSLWRHVAMGTGQFRRDLHNESLYLGIESLAGYVVTRRHGEMIPDLEKNYLQIPIQYEEGGAGTLVRSVAAYPIMQRQRGVAGVLLAASAVCNYFTPERLALLEVFADLMMLVFQHESDFIPREQIELDVMPPLSEQRAHFSNFRQRVLETYDAWRRDRSQQELAGVEAYVLSQMEDELRQAQRVFR